MIDLDVYRAAAMRPVEDSADADQLRLYVLELCDEVEALGGPRGVVITSRPDQ